jgi:hypothetical protein
MAGLLSSIEGENLPEVSVAKKLLEAIAGEQRLYFNDELRRHSKLSVIFNPKGPGHEM